MIKIKPYIIPFFILLFCLQSGYSQNNPPIAKNDTLYVGFNDSLYIYAGGSGGLIYNNDSDPNGDNIFIDTAIYSGNGYFKFTTLVVNSSTAIVRFNFKSPLNFYGLDSIQYIIRDNGNPTLRDTAWIYINVKRPEYATLNFNNINASFSLINLFHNNTNFKPLFEAPKGSGMHTINGSNLWVSGKIQDSIVMNAETNGTTYQHNPISEFKSPAGPIMNPLYYQEYDYQWDRFWEISSLDISQHLNQWNNVTYQPIEVIENWPAHGDTSKGQAFYLAPFIDNNSDGIYNPYDGDYPKIKGHNAIYYIYNDIRHQDTTSNYYSPMKSEVHYMAYTYNCPSDSALNNTVFLDYKIYNRSNTTYDSTYVGFWSEFEIGCNYDDYIACDVARSTFYGYNSDNFDENCDSYKGNFKGYLNNPPVQGVTFLKGVKQDNDGFDNPLTTNVAQAIAQNGIIYPGLGTGFDDGLIDNEHWGMEHFMATTTSISCFGLDPTPYIPIDFYYFLKSVWKNGFQTVWGGNGNPASSGGTIPTKFLYPDNSDPLFYSTNGINTNPTTWNLSTNGSPGYDFKGVGSTGPFTFKPDSSIEISLAFVFGRDYQNTGNTAAISIMKERVDSIRFYYENDFLSRCGRVKSNSDDYVNQITVYPNPSNGLYTIKYTLNYPTATIKVFNSYGKLVKEKIISRNQNTINLSTETNGIYYIQLTDGNKVIAKKIIKQ